MSGLGDRLRDIYNGITALERGERWDQNYEAFLDRLITVLNDAAPDPHGNGAHNEAFAILDQLSNFTNGLQSNGSDVLTAGDIPDIPTIETGSVSFTPSEAPPDGTWNTRTDYTETDTFDKTFNSPPTVVCSADGGIQTKGVFSVIEVDTQSVLISYSQFSQETRDKSYNCYWVAVGE